MNGLILEIGITTLKRSKNNLLIVGYGSIGKKYSQSASQFFNKSQIHIFSKHLQKNKLEKFRGMKDLNYIILSNRANERIKSFKSLLKKGATYIFEKPISSKAFNKIQKKKLLNIIKRNKIKIKTGYCLRLNPAVERLKEAPIEKIIVSDTITISPNKQFEKLEVVSVAEVFAEAIIRINKGDSISELFN